MEHNKNEEMNFDFIDEMSEDDLRNAFKTMVAENKTLKGTLEAETADKEKLKATNGKYRDTNLELKKLRTFVGTENPKLIAKFEELNDVNKEQTLGKFEKLSKDLNTKLIKEEAKLSIGNKQYQRDDLKMNADYNRSTKNTLGRAVAIGSTKVKRALYDFTQNLTVKKEKAVEAVGKSTAYVGETAGVASSYAGSLAKTGWENSGKKVVEATKDQVDNLKTKIQLNHKYLDAKMTMMEQKASKEEEFKVGNSSSVIARAASLGTHNVKKALSSKLESVKESTKEGFNALAKTGKSLFSKLQNAVKAVHSVGMEGVQKREENKNKDKGMGL